MRRRCLYAKFPTILSDRRASWANNNHQLITFHYIALLWFHGLCELLSRDRDRLKFFLLPLASLLAAAASSRSIECQIAKLSSYVTIICWLWWAARSTSNDNCNFILSTVHGALSSAGESQSGFSFSGFYGNGRECFMRWGYRATSFSANVAISESIKSPSTMRLSSSGDPALWRNQLWI